MRCESANQKVGPGCMLRCAPLILALLAVSPVFSFESSSPVGQLQHATNEIEKKSTEHSICFAVQVGAYKERPEVGAMLDKLAQEFPYRMMVTQVGTGDKTRWRLRVLATSRVEAFMISERLLAEQGVEAWIVPIPCTHWVNGKQEPSIPAPSDPPLTKEQVVAPPRETEVISRPVESPAPLSERMVWLITITTFLVTAFVVLLICILHFQRLQIREALRKHGQRRMEKRIPARIPLKLSSLGEPVIHEIAFTENVSSRGARVATQSGWRPEDNVLVKLLRGGMRTHARIAYLETSSGVFAIGLQFSTVAVPSQAQTAALASSETTLF